MKQAYNNNFMGEPLLEVPRYIPDTDCDHSCEIILDDAVEKFIIAQRWATFRYLHVLAGGTLMLGKTMHGSAKG